MSNKRFSLALHGGAGSAPGHDYSQEIAHMRGLVEAARDRLAAGASALEVAVETVVALEASGLYIAGMKSYGRAPTFLMATGYEQVRSIAADGTVSK